MKTLILALLLLIPIPALAQDPPVSTVNATYTFCDCFDIPANEFNVYHVPGIELKLKNGFTFDGKFYFDYFTREREMTSLRARFDKTFPKWTLGLELENISYYQGYKNKYGNEVYQDWRTQMDVTYRLKTFDK